MEQNMRRFGWAATSALLAGLLLVFSADAQTPPASGATGHRATMRSPYHTRPATRHSHRSPTHHRQSHNTISRGTPVHGTMAGPRM
jgi:hypothetical protein